MRGITPLTTRRLNETQTRVEARERTNQNKIKGVGKECENHDKCKNHENHALISVKSNKEKMS